MELVVNTVLGLLILIYDLVRAVGEWGGGAVLTALGAAAGTYLGVRAAHKAQARERTDTTAP